MKFFCVTYIPFILFYVFNVLILYIAQCDFLKQVSEAACRAYEYSVLENNVYRNSFSLSQGGIRIRNEIFLTKDRIWGSGFEFISPFFVGLPYLSNSKQWNFPFSPAKLPFLFWYERALTHLLPETNRLLGSEVQATIT